MWRSWRWHVNPDSAFWTGAKTLSLGRGSSVRSPEDMADGVTDLPGKQERNIDSKTASNFMIVKCKEAAQHQCCQGVGGKRKEVVNSQSVLQVFYVFSAVKQRKWGESGSIPSSCALCSIESHSSSLSCSTPVKRSPWDRRDSWYSEYSVSPVQRILCFQIALRWWMSAVWEFWTHSVTSLASQWNWLSGWVQNC